MRRLAAIAVVVGAGCGYDYDAVPPPVSQFVASPAIAGTDDTLVIEGRFADDFTVYLPGASGRIQPVTELLGSRRVAITVPAQARSGAIELRFADYEFPGPAVRLTSFAPALGTFASTPAQFDAGHLASELAQGRAGAAVFPAGDWLYVVGGRDGATVLGTIERARVFADGTLGPFEAAGTIAPRAEAATLVLGAYVYLIGGRSSEGVLATIERAPLGPDGLGAFEPVAATLRLPRARARAVVVGDQLLVIGGVDATGPTATIEQAPVLIDGIGELAASPLALATPREAAATVVTRAGIYVVGGESSVGATIDAEQLAVTGDGAVAPAIGADTALTSPHAGLTTWQLGAHVYATGGTTAVEQATIDGSGALGAFSSAGATALGRSDAGVTVARDHAYLVGGISTAAVASVETASVAAGATPEPPAASGSLTTARASAAYVAIGSQLCAIGGSDGTGALATTECADVAADGSLGSFAAATPLATPRADPAVAVIGPWLYVIGGNDGTAPIASIERAPITDGKLGTFAPVAAQLGTARSGARAIVLGRQLHVLGGWFEGTTLTTFESTTIAADGSLGTFANGNIQVPQVQGAAVGVVGPNVYVIGAGKLRRALVAGELFESFGDAGGIPIMQRVAATVVGDRVLVTGGSSRPGSIYAAPITATGLSATFSELVQLQIPRLDAGFVALGEWLYVLGGRDATTGDVLSSIERAQLR
ncbi:MAG TPA: hypothetical protein VFQ53_31660 [Kofleriaceae bacterium]|nr:hypothetical protein [Kofleriaceae bacterium]